jgi:hypothetical protein
LAEILDLVKLVGLIIKSPIKAIKGVDLISYDRDAMLRLFSIVSALNIVLEFSAFYNGIKLVGIFLLVILAPPLMFLICNIGAVLYYATFKVLGKGIEANYYSIKIALYPLFLTSMVLNAANALLIRISPFVSNIFQYAISLWFYAMTFLLLKYKLKQSTSRSIFITLVPLFIAFIIQVVRVISRSGII